VIPGAFEYHRPTSLDEAIGIMADKGDTARVLAGGHSLIPMMKLRLAMPEHIVDLQAIDQLNGISEDGGSVVMGATTTQAEIIASDLIARACPLIIEAATQIADPQVRACGTIGGNLANGDPANDMPAVMLALNAEYRVRGPEGERRIAARDFYEGTFVTALGEGEILVAIHLPPSPAGYAYTKQKRKVGDYATAAAAVVLAMQGGKCSKAAIALTNVGDTPLLASAAAAALVGTAVDAAAIDAAAEAAMSIARPVADGRGPSDFRTHIAGVMTRRAIETARGRAA